MTDGYAGSVSYAAFIAAGGGTTVLTGKFREQSLTPSVALIDQTAGADATKSYIPNVTDGQYSLSCLAQTGGSAFVNAMVAGAQGTLVLGFEGTAAGKPKKTIPVISLGAKLDMPYNDVVTVSVDFQFNGAVVDASW